MHRINENILSKLLAENDSRIKLLVDTLADYADHISKMESELSKLDLNTSSGVYMAGLLDSQRREKHDIAISSLHELNDISNQKYSTTLYDGSFDDKYRNEIAQAIMVACETYLDL